MIFKFKTLLEWKVCEFTFIKSVIANAIKKNYSIYHTGHLNNNTQFTISSWLKSQWYPALHSPSTLTELNCSRLIIMNKLGPNANELFWKVILFYNPNAQEVQEYVFLTGLHMVNYYWFSNNTSCWKSTDIFYIVFKIKRFFLFTFFTTSLFCFVY